MQFTPAVGSQPKRGTTMALTIWVSGSQELYGSIKRGHTWCVGIHRFTALGWDLRPGFWSMGVMRVFITRSGLLQKRNCQLDLAFNLPELSREASVVQENTEHVCGNPV